MTKIPALNKAQLVDYIRIARPDNWLKNIFMVPGMLFALAYFKTPFTHALLFKIIIGFASTCLIASANYVINEYLDIEFDKYHPVKKNRALVKRMVNPKIIYVEYAALAIIGLLLAYLVSQKFLGVSAFFLLMGIVYNVRPFRSKEKVYLDVLF
ncbi:MAG: UbiA family prenyltransferase [Niabella sp.]